MFFAAVSNIQQATDAIYAYTYGMDTGRWAMATQHFASLIDVDYSQVGAPNTRMSNSELQTFLAQLLGKPDLKVHTLIAQVFAEDSDDTKYVAYYVVRHFKGPLGDASTYFVYGWYSFHMLDGKINSLTINVQATEGDSSILA